MWEYEDTENVDVIVERKIDRHNAKVESRTKGSKNKPYKGQDGEYFVSRLELMPWVIEQGGDWPTAEDYYRKLAEDED